MGRVKAVPSKMWARFEWSRLFRVPNRKRLDDHIQKKNGSNHTIREVLPPTNVKELQQVLGLCQYYRVFIPKFAHVARPLTRLLAKKVKFKWSEACQKAFEFLKDALCSYPVLTCYNPEFQLVLDTDYQKTAVSAILGMRNPAHKKSKSLSMHPEP